MEANLSESEQFDRIREWWNENGWYLVGGVVLGLILIFGYRWYKSHQLNSRAEAGELYAQLSNAVNNDQIDTAADLLTQLRDGYSGSPYSAQASLLLAKVRLPNQASQSAANLRYVMQHSGDHKLALIARLRLARVEIGQKHYQKALELLNVDKPEDFAARISIIRGDAYVALGDADAARTSYSNALAEPGANWVDQSLLQMKLAALPAQENQNKAQSESGAQPEAGVQPAIGAQSETATQPEAEPAQPAAGSGAAKDLGA